MTPTPKEVAPHTARFLDRMEQEELAIVRRAYAKQMLAVFGVTDPRVEAALAAIQRLFASDEAALKVITGLISGMAAEDIRHHYDLTAVKYDTTRRRIRRTLLRHGLGWSWP